MKYRRILIAVIALVFVFIYSYLNLGNSKLIFSWPDEVSNFAFSANFADQLNFRIEEPLNLVANDQVFPRSFKVVDHDLAPVGFLGLPLIYGLVGSFVPDAWLIFLTPILAVLGVYYFYKLNRAVFESEIIGALSALLLLTTPAFAYYASFAMLPNVPMVSFLIIGAYFIYLALEKKNQYKYFVSAGISIGLALLIRPIEAVWIAPILILVAALNWKKVKFKYLATAAIPMATLTLLYLYLNQLTYGGTLNSGYTTQATGWSQLIFPFGINLSLAIKNFVLYVVLPQWHFFTLGALAVSSAIFYAGTKNKKSYLAICAILGVFLILYYCSWQLADLMILNISRLGVSFNRYLLPLMIALIPLMAWYINEIYEYKSPRAKPIFYLMVLISLALSIRSVYFSGHDNLRYIKKSIQEYTILQTDLLNLIPEDGIVFSERGDKIIYPYRAVISQMNLQDLSGLNNLLANDYKVYYLSYGQASAEMINLDLELKVIGELKYNYHLYEFKRL